MTCTQCGNPKPDNGWTICGECCTRNIAYRHECERLAHSIRQEYLRSPPARMQPPELRRPSEMRGRKARSPAVIAHLMESDDDD